MRPGEHRTKRPFGSWRGGVLAKSLVVDSGNNSESGGLGLHDSFRGTRDRFLVRWYSTWSFIRSSSTVREGETFADKPGCGSLIPIGLDWILFSNTHGKYRTEKRITEYGAG